MIEIATTIALVLLGLGLLATVIRLVRGPTLADRILALDTATVIAVGILGAYALKTGLFFYADLAVATALVGVVATIAFARYLLVRGHD